MSMERAEHDLAPEPAFVDPVPSGTARERPGGQPFEPQAATGEAAVVASALRIAQHRGYAQAHSELLHATHDFCTRLRHEANAMVEEARAMMNAAEAVHRQAMAALGRAEAVRTDADAFARRTRADAESYRERMLQAARREADQRLAESLRRALPPTRVLQLAPAEASGETEAQERQPAA